MEHRIYKHRQVQKSDKLYHGKVKAIFFGVEIVLIPETKLGGTTLSGTSGKLLHSCIVLAHHLHKHVVQIVRCCSVRFIEVFGN